MDRNAFATLLVARRELIPYVTINFAANESIETLQRKHVDHVSEFVNYYHFGLIGNPIRQESKTPDLSSLTGFHKRQYHCLKYIEYKIFKLLSKKREQDLKLIASLIEYLQACPPTSDKMYVCVNLEKLVKMVETEPPHVRVLRALFNYKVQLVGNVAAALTNEQMVRTELIQIIRDVARSVDPKNAFFPIHPRQVEFERLFMSNMLTYGERFNELVADFPPPDSQMFLQELFRFIIDCLDDLGINQRPNDSALVLLLFRFIFDRLYASNRNVYFESDGEDIIGELYGLTLKYLSPPQGFCPPYDESCRIVDYFRRDERFMLAIRELEQVVFHTNPFDILDCVERCLTQIEAAATFYSEGKVAVFEFEVTFVLFLGVVMSSQIRNWVNISNFMEAYTPMSGLCASFEFSRTKVTASMIQFRKALEDIKEGNAELVLS